MDLSTLLIILVILVLVAVLVLLVWTFFTARRSQNTPAPNEENTDIQIAIRQQIEDSAHLKAVLEAQAQNINSLNTRMDSLRSSLTEQLARDSQNTSERMAHQMSQIDAKLADVHKGLGQMQSLTSSVGSLQKVLGNVKTRGTLGEVQLSAILSEILAPEQYETNVATKPGSTKRVEFAVRIPREDTDKTLLPIDAKFPGDTYTALLDALDTNDASLIEPARKQLIDTIKKEAKDISEKYLSVPATTNYAIMFLPFEGLYAEAVQQPQLIMALLHEYSVVIAGPSTMAAILNSLQMSYQTVAIQKQTNDILRVLQEVKMEMPKYQAVLEKAKKNIETAGKTIDSLITTRTNVMERKLKDISLPKHLAGDTLVDDDSPQLPDQLED